MESQTLTPQQKSWYNAQVKEWEKKRIKGQRVAIPYGWLKDQALKIGLN